MKRILRLVGIVILIGLACFGVGLSGTPPVPPPRQKHPTENVETKEEKDDELRP